MPDDGKTALLPLILVCEASIAAPSLIPLWQRTCQKSSASFQLFPGCCRCNLHLAAATAPAYD
jgi:hypothetical protein